jgi:hypothetical protein
VFRRLAEGRANKRGIPPSKSPPVTPLTIIKSVAVTHWFRADLGVTLAAGKVSGWNDQVGSDHFVQAVVAQQPTFAAADATLSGIATITTDGVDDLITAPANPSGQIFIASVMKLIAPGASGAFYSNQFGFSGDGNYVQCFGGNIYQAGPSANANIDMGAVAPMVGVWARYFDRRQNNAADYIKIGSRAKVTGTPCPLAVGIGNFSLGGATGVAIFQAMSYRELITCAGEPTPAELAALDAYFLKQSPIVAV